MAPISHKNTRDWPAVERCNYNSELRLREVASSTHSMFESIPYMDDSDPKIASFPIFATLAYIMKRDELDLPTPPTIAIVIIGIVVSLHAQPSFLPGPALLLLAYVLEAAAVILTIRLVAQGTSHPSPANMVLRSAPVCSKRERAYISDLRRR